jgi:tripartite-type tricarboxylate transporter receptor subunit TctC
VGIFAPPDTPHAVINTIASATQTAVAAEDYRKRLDSVGFQSFPDASPEKMAQIDKQLYETWAPIIKAIGLRLN